MNGCAQTVDPGARGQASRRRWMAVVLCMLVALNVAARLSQYAHNRSLWIDEAALALNIIHYPLQDLASPLDYRQNSPVGFLMAEKAVTILFGASEYALRLVPLLNGLASVFLLCWLARRFWDDVQPTARFAAMVMVLGLFTGQHMVYYASELRHYSTDIALTCLLTLLGLSMLDSEKAPKSGLAEALVFGAVCSVAVWFSLAAFFVAVAVGIVLLDLRLRRAQWRPALLLGLACTVVAASFYQHLEIHALNIAARNLAQHIRMGNRQYFMPLFSSRIEDFGWFYRASRDLFAFPGGMRFALAGALLAVTGMAALWKRDKRRLGLVVLPIGLTLMASAFQRYPFGHRFVLFLAPCLFLLIGEGVAWLWGGASRLGRAGCLVAAALVLMQPLWHGARVVVRPYGRCETRELFDYMREHWEEGDGAYMVTNVALPFIYYWRRTGFRPDSVQLERPSDVFEPDDDSRRRRVRRMDVYEGTRVDPEHERLRREGLRKLREDAIEQLTEEYTRVWLPVDHDTLRPLDVTPGEVTERRTWLDVVHGEGVSLYLVARPDE